MHVRHNGDCQEVREETTPYEKHFAQHGMNNMVIHIIDGIQKGWEDAEDALKCLEGVWQHRQATFEAHGNINSRDETTVNRNQKNNHTLAMFARGILDM